MCGKGKVIFMIGDILCENVSVAWLWVYKNKTKSLFFFSSSSSLGNVNFEKMRQKLKRYKMVG